MEAKNAFSFFRASKAVKNASNLPISSFDEIISHYNCHKIKLINDLNDIMSNFGYIRLFEVTLMDFRVWTVVEYLSDGSIAFESLYPTQNSETILRNFTSEEILLELKTGLIDRADVELTNHLQWLIRQKLRLLRDLVAFVNNSFVKVYYCH